jgi:hypothetical protein
VSKGTCLGDKIEVADSPRRRMVGLLQTASLEPQCGLLIYPTQAVHTFGMKYPIDIIFLNRKKKVIAARRAVRPNRLTRIYWTAECVIELPENTIFASKTEQGDLIEWEESPFA